MVENVNNDVLLLIDRKSFPVKCPELDDLEFLFTGVVLEFSTDNPTQFFNKALEMTGDYNLVVPVTRNFYVRDKLKMEGVSLIICL